MHNNIVVSTTDQLEYCVIETYCSVVSAELLTNTNIFKGLLIGMQTLLKKKQKSYGKYLHDARYTLITDLKHQAHHLQANAIVGLNFQYHFFGAQNTTLLITATGTAVRVKEKIDSDSRPSANINN